MQAPGVGYEHDVVVGACDEHRCHVVLILGLHAGQPDAAAALLLVRGQGDPLDVAALGDRDDHVLPGYQVLLVGVDGGHVDLGAALVAVVGLHLLQLAPDDLPYAIVVGQDVPEVGHQFYQAFILFFERFDLQSRELLKAHVQYRLGLVLVYSEERLQPCIGLVGVLGRAYERQCLVQHPQGLDQALHQVVPLFGGRQVELGPPPDDAVPVLNVMEYHIPERKQGGPVVYERQIDDSEGGLQICLLEKVLQDHIDDGVPVQLDHYAHAVPVGLVAEVRNALDVLVLDAIRDVLHQDRLVDLVRELVDYYAGLAVGHLLDVGLCADPYPSPACPIRGMYSGKSVDYPARGEVRPFDELHQLVGIGLRPL